jgi:hypothetical protein
VARRARGFGGFVLKSNGWFAGLVLKTGEGQFTGLGLKTRYGRFDGLGLKTIGGRFDRFRPQNQGVADQRTRGGISKLASRRSDVEKAPGPLDRCRKI